MEMDVVILEGEVVDSGATKLVTRTELKTLLIKKMIGSMALLVKAGYTPSLLVVTEQQRLEIPWTELPFLLRDDEGGGVLTGALNMVEVENIQEVSILGVPRLL